MKMELGGRSSIRIKLRQIYIARIREIQDTPIKKRHRTLNQQRSILMNMIIPEIEEVVNFYNAETVEQIARDTGFIQRESRFGGIEFLGIMTAGLFAEPDASLSRMCGMAKDITPGLEISEPGIHQRICETGVEFLKNLLSKALEISTSRAIDWEIPKLFQAFDRVCLMDSTHIPLPASLSSIWRGSGGDGSASEMKLLSSWLESIYNQRHCPQMLSA